MMHRVLVGCLAVAFLLALPVAARAQNLGTDLGAALSAQGLTADSATAAELDAAVNAVFLAAIEAEGGKPIADMTDAELAAAVGALVTANPDLDNDTIGQLAASAAAAKPGAAGAVAGAATAARPAAAVAIVTATVAKVPTEYANIATAAATAAPDQVGAIVWNAYVQAVSNGVAANLRTLSNTVANATGLDPIDVYIEAVLADTYVRDTINDTTGDLLEQITEENPNQDASPS